jgi:hypothetical protein
VTAPDPDSDRAARPLDEAAVRERLGTDHGAVLDAVAATADALASGDEPFTDGQALASALEDGLAETEVFDKLPAVLATAVDAAGLTLAADPVAAPPYVTVTSRGPILRGSTPKGRLVVRLAVFDVDRAPRRYIRTPAPGRLALRIDLKQ